MEVNSILDIGVDELSKREWRKLFARLTYRDSEQREVTCWAYGDGFVRFPRGVWSELPDHVRYTDKRSFPEFPKLRHTIDLDAQLPTKKFYGQKAAVRAALDEEQGIIVRPPGTGKTQIGLAFAAEVGTRTLVLVHTNDILDQWVQYVENGIPELKGKVGIVKGRTKKIGHITIATVQTLHRQKFRPAWYRQFGAVIVDEAHHVSAKSWEAVLNCCTARYRIGLTATKMRADGMDKTIQHIIGPVIAEEKFRAPDSIDVEIVPVKTKFSFAWRGSFDWPRLLEAIEHDEPRHKLLAEKIDHEVTRGNSVLVLSRRITHLRILAEHCQTFSEWGAMLVGEREESDGNGGYQRVKMTPQERRDVIQKFRKGKIRVMFATQLADEALDVPILNRVFLTFPGKFEGRIIQQLGRALREHEGKDKAIIYDVVDRNVRVLARQWSLRRHFYKKSKLQIRKRRRFNNGA